MCSSTTPKTKAASPAVKGPSTIVKTVAGGSGGGGGSAPAPNKFGGYQEPVPDAVFLSTAGTQQFLKEAKEFYTYFGLQPSDIKSIEALVLVFADPANTKIYNRLLIVSHAHPRGMIIPFFTGGVVGTNKELFREFAKSDFDGLMVLNPFLPDPVFDWGSVVVTIMSNIRSNTARATTMDPFGLKTNGRPEKELWSFFRHCFNLVFVRTPNHVKAKNGSFISAPQRNTLVKYLGEIITQYQKKIEGVTVDGHVLTKTNLDALRTMLTGLTLDDLNADSVYKLSDYTPDNVNYYPTLENAVRAVQDKFHEKVVKMRLRFTPTSGIDIRGCRAGEDADYLVAMREFFDRPENPRLSISAPRWFQSYRSVAFKLPHNRAHVAGFLASTIFNLGHDEQMKGARAWAELIKVNPLHTDFWSTVFNGTPAAFSSLAWRSNIPALFIPTPGLAELTSLDLAGVIGKLKDFFNVPAASIPSAAQITAADQTAFQKFMDAAKQSIENGDGIYYYMVFAGLPVFFFNNDKFITNEGLMVLKTFDAVAMQSWYKCMWAGTLPANASNASTTASINDEISRRVAILQDEHQVSEYAVCPAPSYGERIQISA